MLVEIALIAVLSADVSDVPLRPAASTPVIVKPKPFKERHPRMYRVYRAGRLVCVVVKPFLDVTAATAQIVTPFLLH